MVMKLAYSEARQRFGELCLRVARPRRAAHRRQRARRGAVAHARAHDRGGRVADPAQHHRRTRARAARGSRGRMDLELSDDQVALRDGIASLLAARIPMERVRAGFDRAMFDELARGGRVLAPRGRLLLGRLRRRVRAAREVLHPGAARTVGAARRRADRRVWRRTHATADLDRAPRRARRARRRRSSRRRSRDARRRTRRAVAVAARPAHAGVVAEVLPPLEALDLDGGGVALAGATLTAAFQLGLADRLTEMAVDYAKERVQFDRPIGSFQAIKHMLADMFDAYRGGARRGLRGRREARRRIRRDPASTGWSRAPRWSRARRRSRTARPRRRCSAAWVSRGRSTCTST